MRQDVGGKDAAEIAASGVPSYAAVDAVSTTDAPTFKKRARQDICSAAARTLFFIMLSNSAALPFSAGAKASRPAFSYKPSSMPKEATSSVSRCRLGSAVMQQPGGRRQYLVKMRQFVRITPGDHDFPLFRNNAFRPCQTNTTAAHEIRALAVHLFDQQGIDPQERMAHSDAKSTKIYTQNHIDWVVVPHG